MKSFFAILLLVLLPLNAAFAAAAGYCQHQQETAQAAHFGHHAHQHDSAADKADNSGAQIDPDCGFCHLSFSSFIPALVHLLGNDSPPKLSALPLNDFQSADVDYFDRPPLARLA
jgi:hypothetical protein